MKKSTFGRYTMVSNTTFTDKPSIYPYKPIHRALIYDQDKFVCRGVDMPVEALITDLDLDTKLKADNFVLKKSIVLPFNATQLYVVNLKNFSDDDAQVFISTNQKMNAGESKFNSKLTNRNCTYGTVFENILRSKNIYDEYMSEMKQMSFKTMDVWWLSIEERSQIPFTKDVLVYGFRIDCNQNINFELNGVNDLCNRVSNHPNILQGTCVFNDYLPSNVLNLYAPESEILNLNNVRIVKFVNEKYDKVYKALNNEPNLIKRIVCLLQFAHATTDTISLFYDKESAKGDVYRRENIDANIAVEYLKEILRYNPPIFWISLYLINKLIDHVYNNYVKFYTTRRIDHVRFGFWKTINMLIQDVYKFNSQKDKTFKIERHHVEILIFDMKVCSDVDELENKVRGELNKVEETSLQTDFIKCYMLRHVDNDVLKDNRIDITAPVISKQHVPIYDDPTCLLIQEANKVYYEMEGMNENQFALCV
jgi:hypothetical protein